MTSDAADTKNNYCSFKKNVSTNISLLYHHAMETYDTSKMFPKILTLVLVIKHLVMKWGVA
jgi:hypothetical protein